MTELALTPAVTPNAMEDFFRAQCARALAEMPADAPVIRTIAAVGALDAQFGGNEKDSATLTQMLRYLQKTGVPIAPDFTVDVVNFRENRDFLEEKTAADLVFVAYIIREPVMRVTKCFQKAIGGQRPEDDLDRLSITLSPSHREEKWDARARAAGAKIIITQGGKFEIGSGSFRSFTPLIQTPDAYGTDHDRQTTYTTADFHGAQADFPTPWMGLAAAPEFLKAVAPVLTGRTELARRMGGAAISGAQGQGFRGLGS